MRMSKVVQTIRAPLQELTDYLRLDIDAGYVEISKLVGSFAVVVHWVACVNFLIVREVIENYHNHKPLHTYLLLTRRTARARSLDHQRVTRPRLRINKPKITRFLTGYLRASSDTIEYDRESREFGCELRRSNNSKRSLDKES